MDTTPQKSPKIWPLFSVGCALLILSICGASVALGAGGALWFTHSGSIVKQGQPLSSRLTPEAAELTGLMGWVEVQDQGEWAPASEGQLLRAGQRVRTGELSKATLLFYDGSRAFLGASSELSIDELDAARGNKVCRYL